MFESIRNFFGNIGRRRDEEQQSTVAPRRSTPITPSTLRQIGTPTSTRQSSPTPAPPLNQIGQLPDLQRLADRQDVASPQPNQSLFNKATSAAHSAISRPVDAVDQFIEDGQPNVQLPRFNRERHEASIDRAFERAENADSGLKRTLHTADGLRRLLAPRNVGTWFGNMVAEGAESTANTTAGSAADVLRELRRTSQAAVGHNAPRTQYEDLRSPSSRLGALTQESVGSPTMGGTPQRDHSLNLMDDPFMGEVLRQGGHAAADTANYWLGGMPNRIFGGRFAGDTLRDRVIRASVHEAPIGGTAGAGSGAQFSEGQTPREMMGDIVSGGVIGTGMAGTLAGGMQAITPLMTRAINRTLAGGRQGASSLRQLQQNLYNRLANAEQPAEVGALRQIAQSIDNTPTQSQTPPRPTTPSEGMSNPSVAELNRRANADFTNDPASPDTLTPTQRADIEASGQTTQQNLASANMRQDQLSSRPVDNQGNPLLAGADTATLPDGTPVVVRAADGTPVAATTADGTPVVSTATDGTPVGQPRSVAPEASQPSNMSSEVLPDDPNVAPTSNLANPLAEAPPAAATPPGAVIPPGRGDAPPTPAGSTPPVDAPVPDAVPSSTNPDTPGSIAAEGGGPGSSGRPQAPQPDVPPADRGDMAAPNHFDILSSRELEADVASMRSSWPTKQGASLDDMRINSKIALDSLGSNENIARYYPDHVQINDAPQYIQALEAANRLSADNSPIAREARQNIYAAMAEFASKSGHNLRATQVLWDSMSPEMKVGATIKSLSKNRETPFTASELANLEKSFTAIFEKEAALNTSPEWLRVKEIQSKADNYVDGKLGITAGEAKFVQDQLVKQSQEVSNLISDFSAEYNKYGGSNPLSKKMGDFQRSMMLSSPTGAVLDIVSTGIATARMATTMSIEGLVGRVVNRIAGRPILVDRGANIGQALRSLPGAVRSIRDDATGRGVYSSLEDAARGLPTRSRTDMTGGWDNRIGNFIRSSRSAATHLSRWVADADLEREARKMGQERKLSGDELNIFVDVMKTAMPPRKQEMAQQLALEVNNINRNPITKGMNRAGRAIEDSLNFKTAGGRTVPIGTFTRNAVMPFPTFMSGNIWNALTDRNVIASSVKAINAARKGDAQQFVREATKTAQSATEMTVLGYYLSSQGVLTTQDANGDDYEGLYLNLGERYVPAASVFPLAPAMIAGNALYQGMNSEDSPEGILNTGGAVFSSLMANSIAVLGVGGLVGEGNYLSKAFDRFEQGDGAGGVARMVSGFVGQYVPALTSDINAVLNNSLGSFTGLNPTNERAETTATFTNPETGRENTNFAQTALNQLINRIPIASQTLLDRREGVLAPDIPDRVGRGNRSSDSQIEAAQVAQTLADQKKDFSERGVPHFDETGFSNAVAYEVGRGNYAPAIEGLEAQLADMTSEGKKPNPKTVKSRETEIKRLKVAQQYGFGPNLLDAYWKGENETLVTNSEWKAMGNPDSEYYNPSLYQTLWELDSMMAKAGVSKNATDTSKNFYNVGGSGSGGGGSRRSTISGNTIGTLRNFDTITMGQLRPREAGVPAPRRIAPLRTSELPKLRKISLRRGVS